MMLKSYLSAFKNILFPRICFSCDEKINNGYLCEKCFRQIELIHHPLETSPNKTHGGKRENNVKGIHKITQPYEKLICITKYKGPIVRLIHLFKYQNYDFLVELLGPLMIEHLTKTGFDPSCYDYIAAVPLYSSKLRDRGYNQANLLAQYLAKHFKISLKNDIIYATRESASQTKLNKAKRSINIKGLFKVKQKLKNEKILLVDDIFTTGSTVRECACALKKSGAIVTVLTLSKT